MSARLTVTGDLRGEPWLRFTPTIRGEAAEMDEMVETMAGDVEVALGITLLTPLLCAAGTIRMSVAVREEESIVIDFLAASEPWRTLVNALVPDCT